MPAQIVKPAYDTIMTANDSSALSTYVKRAEFSRRGDFINMADILPMC